MRPVLTQPTTAPTSGARMAPADVARRRSLTAVIVGATGYAGGELVRLLAGHPAIELVGLVGRGRQDEPIGRSQGHLAALDLTVGEGVPAADLVFLALPHGASADLTPSLLAGGATVIDLGADFRLRDAADYPTWYGWQHPLSDLLDDAVYGLPELHHTALQRLGRHPGGIVAAPGCYPTAAILAVAPLARAGLIADLVVDAKSGVSGAGREPRPDLNFSEVNENVRAYGVAAHRHTAEIIQELGLLAGASDAARQDDPTGASDAFDGLEFVPHLIPMTRGILATCYVRPSRPVTEADVASLYAAAYGDEPFVRVVAEPPSTKHVLGTNEARIHVRLQPRTGRIVAIAAIDNLVKGAAGQAVQAANVLAGLDERAGLDALPVNP